MPGELHRSGRIGWMRAAVLGANDGLISTSSLIVGVASAEPDDRPAGRGCGPRRRRALDGGRGCFAYTSESAEAVGNMLNEVEWTVLKP